MTCATLRSERRDTFLTLVFVAEGLVAPSIQSPPQLNHSQEGSPATRVSGANKTSTVFTQPAELKNQSHI
eukprot:656673-Amphidinium_carterae.1